MNNAGLPTATDAPPRYQLSIVHYPLSLNPFRWLPHKSPNTIDFDCKDISYRTLKLHWSWRVSLDESAEVDRLFERAVETHSRRLLTVARGIVGTRASPEDVVQQALMTLYEHRARYDWRDPGGLLRRSVVNESLRILRRPRMGAVGEEHPGRSESPLEAMIDRETVAQVRAAIDRLPENFRAALVLCEYENMAYSQIAETLGASIPQVKTWIHRARRQLAQMLGDTRTGAAADARTAASEAMRK